MIDVEAAARSRLTTASTDARRPAGQPAQVMAAAQVAAGAGRLRAIDGTALHYRSWLPGGQQVMSTLLFSHGIASHGAWFSETATFLAEHGIAVYALDRRGSGLSGGRRGHVDSYEQALGDLNRMIDLISESGQAGPPRLLLRTRRASSVDWPGCCCTDPACSRAWT
jgi:hypothetical protein